MWLLLKWEEGGPSGREKKSPVHVSRPSVSGGDGAANGLFTLSNTRKFMVHVTPRITEKKATTSLLPHLPKVLHEIIFPQIDKLIRNDGHSTYLCDLFEARTKTREIIL